MDKAVNHHKNYINLSKNESGLLNSIKDITIFSSSTIKKLTAWKLSRIRNTIASLKKKKIIVAVKRDNYAIINEIPGNIFAIATMVTEPSYISFWTAMSYMGFTEQQVKPVQVVSTKQYKKIKINQQVIESTTYNIKRFYGYQKIENFAIAEKEKLIIDMLYKPNNCGGIGEVKKCIRNMWPEINQGKLTSYLKKFKNRSIYPRLGFLLDELRLKNNNNLLLKSMGGYIKLNPNKKDSRKHNRKWRLIINDQ